MRIAKSFIQIKDSFSEEEGNTIAAFLSKEIHPAGIISFQVGKNESGDVVVSMVANRAMAEALPDSEFQNLAMQISENTLGGAPVIYQLTDDMFRPFKTFKYKME